VSPTEASNNPLKVRRWKKIFIWYRPRGVVSCKLVYVSKILTHRVTASSLVSKKKKCLMFQQHWRHLDVVFGQCFICAIFIFNQNIQDQIQVAEL